jgi:choline dehydrogenase-like flavoprotein
MAPIFAFASLAALLGLQVVATTSVDNKTYEYIVVGSGPGGGPIASNLARAGHSVLLLEAGCVKSMNEHAHTDSRILETIKPKTSTFHNG